MEKRKDACVARSLPLALPLEFSKSERIELSKGFSLHIANKYQVYTDLAIHEPTRRKYNATANKNPHAHIQFPDRDIHGKKLRHLTKGKMGKGAVNEVTMLRNEWEAFVKNFAQKYEKSFNFTMAKKKPLDQRRQEAENELRNIQDSLNRIRISIYDLEQEYKRNQSDPREDFGATPPQRGRPTPNTGGFRQQNDTTGKPDGSATQHNNLSNQTRGTEKPQEYDTTNQGIRIEITLAYLREIERKLLNNLNNKLSSQLQGEIKNAPTIN